MREWGTARQAASMATRSMGGNGSIEATGAFQSGRALPWKAAACMPGPRGWDRTSSREEANKNMCSMYVLWCVIGAHRGLLAFPPKENVVESRWHDEDGGLCFSTGAGTVSPNVEGGGDLGKGSSDERGDVVRVDVAEDGRARGAAAKDGM